MKCTKTGITFRIPSQSGDTYHGDMYFSATVGCAVIRGLAPGGSDLPAHMELEPHGDAYVPTKISPNFAMWWQEWKREIPLKAFILIADSRF